MVMDQNLGQDDSSKDKPIAGKTKATGGEKSNRCDQCYKVFSQAGYLKKIPQSCTLMR